LRVEEHGFLIRATKTNLNRKETDETGASEGADVVGGRGQRFSPLPKVGTKNRETTGTKFYCPLDKK
jgi:hypothetical protein